jgi:hypothetical protein
LFRVPLIAVFLAGCPGPQPPAEGLPCDVADIVSNKCVTCHGQPLANAAPMSLRTRDDFAAMSTMYPGQTIAERCLARMQMTDTPMPPVSWPVVTNAEQATFSAWVDAGLPAGTCQTHAVDAGPQPVQLTCTSGVLLPQPSTVNPHGSVTMGPGEACISCHAGHDFEGQNPGSGLERLDQIYDVMGTVFPALHEQDLCASAAGDGGTTVEIYDSLGHLVISAPVNAAGNFYGNADGGLHGPYTARVVREGRSSGMGGSQTNGDCNTCHTAMGENGAPGRILAP